jgi:hypothetical protein
MKGFSHIAVHVAHADTVLRGFSAAADGTEASFSAGMPSLATAFFIRTMYRKRAMCFLARCVRRHLSPPRVAFLALRGSFLCSTLFYLLGLCTSQCFPLLCIGFRDPVVTLALLPPLVYSLSSILLRSVSCNFVVPVVPVPVV